MGKIEVTQAEVKEQLRLSVLHRESLEWLSAIEFWKFELLFFQKLVDKNFFRVTLVDKMKELEAVEKVIHEIGTNKINQLETEIRKHEHYLNKFERGDTDVDDVTYRKQHDEQKEKIAQFTREFRAFKTQFFKLLEHVSD